MNQPQWLYRRPWVIDAFLVLVAVGTIGVYLLGVYLAVFRPLSFLVTVALYLLTMKTFDSVLKLWRGRSAFRSELERRLPR